MKNALAAAVLAFLMHCAPAFAQSFDGTMSGVWWNPQRAGEGLLINFETVGERRVVFLAYFTYSSTGSASWLVGNVDYQAGATSIPIPLITGSGARFGAGFRASDVRTAPSGTAVLEYVACDRLRLRYSGTESLTIELTRLVGPLTGVACPNGSRPAASPADTFRGPMTGTWWNATRGGEGQLIAFETVGARNVAFFAYFTYTASGEPTWLIGNTDYRPGAASVSIPLIRGSGARFGAAFRAEDVRIASAGTAVVDYVSCNQLRLRFVGSEDFAFDLTRLVGSLSGVDCSPAASPESDLDRQLRPLLATAAQTGNAARGRVLPSIDDPLAHLGKLLFFSKTLSGRLDTACASCHHPSLGGADGLSFSIGANAANAPLLGPGRRLATGGFSVGRNSNTFFNVGLLDKGLFWDSRIESLGKVAGQNGAGSAIRTPEAPPGVGDPNAGSVLPAAQARFPVANHSEMRGGAFAGASDAEMRRQLAARLGNYGSGAGQLAPSQWLARFRDGLRNPAGTAEELITFDNIALAIAEYERSATFTSAPWARYVRGDNAALADSAKRGAVFFFKATRDGGVQCAQCHSGDLLTDEKHHAVGFPQIGPGKGDGVGGTDDFGRGRETLVLDDRYRYRTPSLLNVELTAPYGHAGAYRDLTTVIEHYVVPTQTVDNFLNGRTWCSLPQFAEGGDCAATAADVTRNTMESFRRMEAVRAATPAEGMPFVNTFSVPQSAGPQLEAFLRSLTDPCLKDRACFARWIPQPSEAPDGHQLNAVDAAGQPR